MTYSILCPIFNSVTRILIAYFFIFVNIINCLRKKNIINCILLDATRAMHIKVINSVPYRPVRSEYTVPASNPVHLTLLFRTGKNTGRTALVPAIPTNFGQYRPVRPVPVGTKKSFFFFLKFCNF